MLLFVAWLYQHRSPILSDTAHTASLRICFTAAGCVLTYLGATCALPLQDAALTRVDHSFGFDWLAWRDAVETWPKLKFLLALAYGSLIPQFLLSSLFLHALGRTKRSVEPILLAAVTLLPTTAVSALWPALGPFAAPGGERVEYLPHVVMLHAPGPWHFDIPTMQGILTMPSYHAVLALFFIYAFRNTGLLGWGIGTVNAVMLVSIAPVGGHYLADIMAGAIIAVMCVVAIRCLATPGLPRSA